MTLQDRLPGIHALRVVAAVTVYLLHILHLTATFVEPVTRVADHLTYGVPLFFAVSAFSLMYSTSVYSDQKGWVWRFYLKRYFRIAPLFYVMLVVDVGLLMVTSLGPFFPQQPFPALSELLTNVTFTFGLVPMHISGLVLIGWSVGAEMLFYAMFPLLLTSIRGVGSALVLCIATHVGGELIRPWLDRAPSDIGFLTTLSDLHVLTNLRFFAFGILAFHIFRSLRETRLGKADAGSAAIAFHLLCAAIAGVLIYVLGFHEPALKALRRTDQALWGVLFTVMCVWFALRPFRFLAWAPIQWLGERSYSLYLIHFPVMLLLPALTHRIYYGLEPFIGPWAVIPSVIGTYIPVVILSAIAYRLIEKPGMDLGRRIEKRAGLGRKAQPAAAE